jgi:hypothetical protein
MPCQVVIAYRDDIEELAFACKAAIANAATDLITVRGSL